MRWTDSDEVWEGYPPDPDIMGWVPLSVLPENEPFFQKAEQMKKAMLKAQVAIARDLVPAFKEQADYINILWEHLQKAKNP